MSWPRRLAGVGVTAGLLAAGLVLAAGLRAPGDAASNAEPATVTLSRPAPPLRGSTLDGGRFDLAEQRGRVVLVNVWASWCAPCRDELPAVATAQRRWSEQGLTVVGVDMRDGAEPARRLLDELGLGTLVTVTDPKGTTAVAWGVRGVPETFVVDRSGTVRVWAQGAVDMAWLEAQIPKALRA
ncbi:TlpA family protein disulfide reductase [Dactylosporangium aurantiacum]|uniref:TlpA family protein disulfide reductase n=1 Tax=Dactylosporangium aurantiacum TaxID=35754 RepID=A0A9Q9ML68_9ACTN|nr:TlpA disulfide reductase family protein [Dactylosporangium aurantiacum]MDG6110499.1 TlpA disulfide reductase family protein [Dactylosporangium aurantiacum]UWZ58645.1 TlpA family protein disulfide reductase [Dactylosporangium aurantiacum]